MSLFNLVESVPNFVNWSHADKIKFFAWHLHHNCNKERFHPVDIRSCYEELHLQQPSNISSFFTSFSGKRRKELLKDRAGYFLPKPIRDELTEKYGRRPSSIQIDQLLNDLPAKITNISERVFLEEALLCLRAGAYRAAIVMTWNLAFDHLCELIITQHLSSFNTQLPITYPKARIKTIKTKDDFENLKESEVLQVCRSANILSGSVKKILDEKLGRRNTSAHPSNVAITLLQAEDFISDLINNVVLKLR
jgi:hypothetical protein